MAIIKNLQTLLMIIFITINILSFLTLAISYSHDKYYKTLNPKKLGLNKNREKLTHFHFYLPDVFSGPNATEVRVAGPQITSNSTSSFGLVAIFDDPMTVGPDPSSKKIGSAQGLYASASQTEVAVLTVLSFVFTEGEFKGSTLSLLGRDAFFSEEIREMPIVGGTGAFRFGRGYALEKTYMYNTTTLDSIMEYNVYVVHY